MFVHLIHFLRATCTSPKNRIAAQLLEILSGTTPALPGLPKWILHYILQPITSFLSAMAA